MSWRQDRKQLEGHDWEDLPQESSDPGFVGPGQWPDFGFAQKLPPKRRRCRRCGQVYTRKVSGMYSKEKEEKLRILPCDEGLVKSILEE